MKTKDSELPELMVTRLLEIVGHCEKREYRQPPRPSEELDRRMETFSKTKSNIP